MSVHEPSYADGIVAALCSGLGVSPKAGKLMFLALFAAWVALVVATGGLE